jgi:hypothetical protein
MSTRGTRKPSTRKTTKADKVEKPVKEEVEEKSDDEVEEKEVKEEKPIAPKPIVPKSLIPPTPTPSPSTFKSEKSDDDKKELPEKAPILSFDDVLNGNFDKKPAPKSITEFDYDEIRKVDVGSIKKLDNITLMKILVVRGRDEKNPAIWQAMQRLLKQVNCEFDPLQPEPTYQQRDSGFQNQRRDYDGRQQGGRGGFVPRSGFNGGRGGFNQGRGGYAPRGGFNGGRGNQRFPETSQVSERGYQPEQRQMPTDD